MDQYTKELMSAFKPPFRYMPEGSAIFDSNDNHVLDIRGWGFLSNRLGAEAAASVQDHLGEYLVDQLNNDLK